MKKLQIILVAGMSIATLSAKAQLLSAKLPNEAAKVESPTSTAGLAKNSSAAMSAATKAGSRAVSKFKTMFLDGPDVKWFVEEKVITSTFTRDNIRTTVVYDKHGHWIRNMKIYGEAQMSPELRAIVKRSRYAKYDISQVQEFLENDLLFYIVHLENAKSYKQITVYNGEINLLSQFEKAN